MDKKKHLKIDDHQIINHLKNELDKARKETNDFKNKYLRALADYQNFEKRVREEQETVRVKGKQEIFIQLLSILDSLEKAEVFIKDVGLKQVKDSFCQLLRDEQIEEINLLGKEFDPRLAEAVDVVVGERDNIVVEVLRKGYRFGGKILRVAQVKVSKKSEIQNPKSETNPNF
ncbi:nucleotide exchange factor GrpE [Candidatus Roizmanbacteria bacterium CG02_land_8_20_14_3_00_36_15]|uniref:Protein GrpE n=2 Tax=Candidatus Roizmaniibacteriota TaxID=1752723 RepID=A0A2M8KLP0_9BACT|nr:MAG: nucleotide exchange factor GrpE [Candidatus Roizmanbacteria bacterium CG03_land_8_20_14_0_80_36_21]PIV37930.1 MAG: nucleotide exchange factor GrpE [Candidatus Roizmanbacteria bacterium CG02_land_8_20_14_3_00_36_15]PIY69900.1 MAG: nucleotide exchange factor GrpE [Candidatus Roizmanbacteria bacterium CG_4_10_14_0_8_um_filter_36_36]PJA53906.1 MAG: nucleotide exchange factor GrpE [Candidatus Roizmanbacteria bacterium CG_4_9_14_3_um_filter_36_11]PJC82106.1 MAG: nucleotide exchange factor Grp